MSSSSSGRRTSRGGGGNNNNSNSRSGRGGRSNGPSSGGGNRRGGRGNRSSSSGNNNNNSNNRRTSSTSTNNGGESTAAPTPAVAMPNMKDEEVLIAFMPYMRGNNREAMVIHESYQSNNDYAVFLREARSFLAREKGLVSSVPPSSSATQSTNVPPRPHETGPSTNNDSTLGDDAMTSATPPPIAPSTAPSAAPTIPPHITHSLAPTTSVGNTNGLGISQNLPQQAVPLTAFQNVNDTPSMESMEQKMANLLSGGDDVVAMPTASSMISSPASQHHTVTSNGVSGSIIGGATIPSSSTGPINPSVQSLLFPSTAGPGNTLPIGSVVNPQHRTQPHATLSQNPMQSQIPSQLFQQQHPQLHQEHHILGLPQQQRQSQQQHPGSIPLSHNFSQLQHAQPNSLYNELLSRQTPTQNNQHLGMTNATPPSQFSMFSSNGTNGPPPGIGNPSQSPLLNPQPIGGRDIRSQENNAWSIPPKPFQNQPYSGQPLGPSAVGEPPGLPNSSIPFSLQGRSRTPSESSRSPMHAPIGSPAMPSTVHTPQQVQVSGPRISPTPLSLSSAPPSVSKTSAPPVEASATEPAPTPTETSKPTTGPTIPARTPKKEYQPKRLWTHIEDQPGKILVNNVSPSDKRIIHLHPRQELTARWMLPLSYLQQMAFAEDRPANSLEDIRDLIKDLSLGLFRRGCTENGSQASIVSKEIVQPSGGSREDYPFQISQNWVVGSIPFYSPRTPGHVLFRLYWRDHPVHTLATGPTLNVRVTEDDFESAIRFILSNFKAKKVNPTSLSSLNSLSLVLEQFEITSTKPSPSIQRQLESAGRAVWGCVCEARKVLDACAVDYHKTTSKLEKLEEAVDDLKEKVASEEQEKLLAAAAAGKDTSEGDNNDDGTTNKDEEPEEVSINVTLLREKTKALMTGRASCERKWRDSQLAFASILRSIVFNRGMSLLLRKELITKLRLEYELWCPLCEEFAVPGDQGNAIVMWYQPLNNLSQPISVEHFRMCQEARAKLQFKILGFVPNTTSVRNLLFQNQNRMSHVAVNSLNLLSSSMGKLYQDVYFTEDRIFQQRENIRAEVERLVGMCDSFPTGTKVAIFGSSANGFGSPKSDLDMCLQIPEGQLVFKDDDPTGSTAMASLAKILEENGMMDVDTSRLTARIPVIKFNSRRGTTIEVSSDEETLMECDLSMHNPLAVLNTSLLRTYAEINPVPRVMAAVIKRWAKARDINNPARHTLSSYGYILMLLHFLTYHRKSENGMVAPLRHSPGSVSGEIPLLPNLQWMDDKWPEMPPGTPYRELQDRPNHRMQHPIEDTVKINPYFYRTNKAMMQNLQRLFPGQDLSLAILLTSFFRYYAYEFDYKRNVVSLHSTIRTGLAEREVKAELDGWRNYSAALTIEDPFETFYDVAHVLRGGYYHRIRREFAVAYTKIADVTFGKASTTWNNKVVDLTNMTGMALIDWICEEIDTTNSSSTSTTPAVGTTTK